MTREEKISWLQSLPKETISPQQLAVVTGGNPYYYNIAAKDGTLSQETMPHYFAGRNLRFWKAPIIKLIGG